MPADEVFHKFKKGSLRSGSGEKVTKRDQAVAIAMSYEKGRSKDRGKTKKKSAFDRL